MQESVRFYCFLFHSIFESTFSKNKFKKGELENIDTVEQIN